MLSKDPPSIFKKESRVKSARNTFETVSNGTATTKKQLGGKSSLMQNSSVRSSLVSKHHKTESLLKEKPAAIIKM